MLKALLTFSFLALTFTGPEEAGAVRFCPGIRKPISTTQDPVTEELVAASAMIHTNDDRVPQPGWLKTQNGAVVSNGELFMTQLHSICDVQRGGFYSQDNRSFVTSRDFSVEADLDWDNSVIFLSEGKPSPDDRFKEYTYKGQKYYGIIGRCPTREEVLNYELALPDEIVFLKTRAPDDLLSLGYSPVKIATSIQTNKIVLIQDQLAIAGYANDLPNAGTTIQRKWSESSCGIEVIDRNDGHTMFDLQIGRRFALPSRNYLFFTGSSDKGHSGSPVGICSESGGCVALGNAAFGSSSPECSAPVVSKEKVDICHNGARILDDAMIAKYLMSGGDPDQTVDFKDLVNSLY